MNSPRRRSASVLATSLRVALLLGATSAAPAIAEAGLINGSFENPPQSPGVASNGFVTNSTIPGWKTTAPDENIEIWSDDFLGVSAYEGTQHAELNAFFESTLYQDSAIAGGLQVGFQFAHRGRAGTDTMRLTITDLGLDNLLGGGNDTVLFTKTYTTGNAAWAFYTSFGEAPIFTLGNTVRFAYESVSSVGGTTIGNFLDAADFGTGVAGTPSTVPEPGTLTLMACGLGTLLARRRRARHDA